MDIPVLRQDLRLLPGSRDEAGESGWLLYDPLRHQYFALTRSALLLLRLLPKITSLDDLKARLANDQAQVDEHDIEQFLGFLNDNFLSVGSDAAHVEKIAQAHKKRQNHWFMWLVHNYLFIKIPLIRPDGMLDNLLRMARPLASRPARLATYALGLYGVFALIWQWEQFVTTFDHFFNWQGLSYYFLALIGVKIAHELGHALVAKHHGLRVSSMGVALLVLFPVLYTDNTDAWRLTDQRKKLQIVLAGLTVELHIALLALFSWGILDAGPAKSAAFFLATTSIAGSLLVNLSPFMRFDGYYALADFLGMQNLQPRAFELARWQLRQWLFGLPENAPEPFPPGKHFFLVIYSFATWVYRLFLFIGIALLVYFMAFKLLGLFLFIVEIIWFILRPIYAEMKRWWAKRAMFSLNRPTLRSVFIFLLLSGLAFAPWRMSISTPAILESGKQIPIHLKEAAQISELRAENHQYVEAGAVLLVASQPSLEHDIDGTARRVRLLELQLRRYANSRDDLSNKLVTEQKLGEMQSRLSALMARRAELTLRAPAAGYLQLSRPLSVEQWVQPSEQLFFIFDKQNPQIVAFISEEQMHRVRRNSTATFIANDGIHETLRAHIATIEETAIESVTYYEMTSEHDGPIAVRQDASNGASRPEEAYYKALAHPITQSDSVDHNIIGELHIETAAYAPFNALWNGIAALLVRESGF